MYTIYKVKLKTCSEIAYIDEGNGEKTIFFLHGLATYGLCWKKNIDELKKQYRCIAIDLPGNGNSKYEKYDYSISFFAECVKEFIDKLSLKNICLAGHSLGGQIALKFTQKYPDCVDSLVLCAPAGFETFTGFETSMYQSSFHFFNFFSSEENSLKKSITGSFYHYTEQADEMIDDLVKILKQYPAKEYRHMMESSIHGMLHEPVFKELKQIKQPALVIFGERDSLIPNRMIHPYNTRKIAEDGVKQMPNAHLEMIPQSGHYVHWEKSKQVNELIKEFLN